MNIDIDVSDQADWVSKVIFIYVYWFSNTRIVTNSYILDLVFFFIRQQSEQEKMTANISGTVKFPLLEADILISRLTQKNNTEEDSNHEKCVFLCESHKSCRAALGRLSSL